MRLDLLTLSFFCSENESC